MSSPWTDRRLHFIGIGGAGMSGLALIARQLGATVSGSDRAESAYIERLRQARIEPAIGHAAKNVPPQAEVVRSTAIPAENPELARARELGLPELHRAQLLAQIAQLKRCIAVTGTHGKTTTTAMIAHVLRGAGADPAYVVGAELRGAGVNAAWGSGEWIVIEADESDRSLLELTPEIAVLTNAELDHHSTYASLQDLHDTFRRFMASATGVGAVWDRPELRALCPPETVPYDVQELHLSPSGASFSWRGERVGLSVPGAHNAVNAAGALTACALTGVEPARAVAAIADFVGARRRLEPVGTTPSGAQVMDDYAHHPTEVAAALAAARSLGPRRLVAVFQPHLYSRTQALGREFGAALAAADVIAVLPVYPARERQEDFPGVSGLKVAEAAADHARGRTVAWLPSLGAAETYLRRLLRAGDLALTLGAGNVDSLAHTLCGI